MTRWRPLTGLAVASLAVGATFQIAPGGTSAEAREIRHVDGVETLTDADWWQWDRAVFSVLSQVASQDRIPSHMADWFDGGANTFIDAARRNTALVNPSAYATVSQRHAYYELIGFLLEFDPETPEPLRNVRFFHAAAEVTAILQLGAVGVLDTWRQWNPAPGFADRCAGIGVEARRLLIDMNAYLFDQHMSVVHWLFHDWLEPRNPESGHVDGKLSAWDFDVAMILLEQRLVERYLQDAAPTLTAIQEINDLQRNCLFTALPALNPTRELAPLLSLVGIEYPVFSQIYDRVAVGIAWVTIFHGRSSSDYLTAMAAIRRELERQ